MNKYRKYKKFLRLWDYYYYKDNSIKSISSYLRCIKLWDCLNENVYLNLAYCYRDIWNMNKALYYINTWLKISGWKYSLIELKWQLLDKMWNKMEAQKYFDRIIEIDKKIKEHILDLDIFYSLK